MNADRLPVRIPGWHRRIGPRPILAAVHDLPHWHGLPRWVDHAYRYRHPMTGRWVWVAEPYGLDSDALADIAVLAAFFDVSVSAEHARHYPGRTVAVSITSRETA